MAEPQTQKPTNLQASASISPAGMRTPATAMLSHCGRVRHANQDACATLPELGAFVVCDGIGGAAAGEVASQLAAEAFLHALKQPRRRRTLRTPPNYVRSSGSDLEICAGLDVGLSMAADGTPAIYPENHPYSRLREAVCAANHAVFRHSRRSQALRGMGTTLVGALWDESDVAMLWLAHVGDSRCYRMRGGTLELLTADHSLVEEQVRAGTLSRVEAEVSPIRNIITRAVGSEPAVEPEIAAHATQPGDVYLLATDGLTRELDDTRIARILSGFFPHTDGNSVEQAALRAACHALIDAANFQGGRDNITVLLIACP